MRNFRYLNSVAIAYILVTLLTFAVLVGMEPKLPEAFVIALTSVDFWLRYAGGAAVFVGVIFIMMLVAYFYAGRVESQSNRLVSGLVGAFLSATFYGTTLAVLLLSGMRH